MRTKYALITLLSAALPVLAFAQNPATSTNNPPASTNSATHPPGDAKLQQTLPKAVDDAEFQALRSLALMTTGQVSRVELEGAVVRAAQAGQPWQVINPVAPMEFGDGWDNVSLDPRTRQPSGIVLLSIRFGKMGSHRK